MKHTPGPWTVKEEKNRETGDLETILYGQRQWIHAIGQPWILEQIGILDCEASHPDARLIEAAPLLLDALELARGRLEEDCAQWIIETIDFAIARVEGDPTR